MHELVSLGFYLMYRGWLNHPLFIGDVYCKRAAWISLIDAASHSNRRGLMRGQLYASGSTLARYWGWSKSKVHRFLNLLQKQHMIEIETRDKKLSIITICNYDIYQSPDRAKPTPPETHFARLNDHVRNANETPYNQLNQNQELIESDIQSRQLIEELSTILGGCIIHPSEAPCIKDLSEPKRWQKIYDWDNLVIPTIRRWAATNRKRAQPRKIRSWTYFSQMLETEFQKQRHAALRK